MLAKYGYTALPVIDDRQRLVGIISRRDLPRVLHRRRGSAVGRWVPAEQPPTASRPARR